jgi:hypothetical protein
MVWRLKGAVWISDWCLQIRVDHGKPFPGAKKVMGEDLWIEFGVVVWGSDLSPHHPGEDEWKNKEH